jgi:hypothetical protein
MHGTSYRLNAETVGIVSENQQRLTVLIPYGAVVTAINGLGNRTVDVMWDDKTVTVFTEDLRARGELVPSNRLGPEEKRSKMFPSGRSSPPLP